MSATCPSPADLLCRVVASTGLTYRDVMALRTDALNRETGELTVRWPDGRERRFRLDPVFARALGAEGDPCRPLLPAVPVRAQATPCAVRPEEVRSFVSARRGFSRSFTTVFSDQRRTNVVIDMLERKIRGRTGRVSVLDVGCNRGVALFEVAGRLRGRQDVEYVGLDAVEEPLEYARRRAEFEGLAIRFLHARMPGSGIAAGSFDVVLCAEVLEHIPFPEDVLSELHAILRPGGALILSTPNAGSPLARLAKGLDRAMGGRLRRLAGQSSAPMVDILETEKLDVYGHVSVHGHREWARILAGCGFREREVRRCGLWPGAPWLDRHPSLFALMLLSDQVLDWVPFATSWCWDFAMQATRD